MANILLYASQKNGQLSSNAKEALAFGSRLARIRNGEVEAVLLGSSSEKNAQEVILCGASKVYTVSNPILDEYQIDLYLDALTTTFHQSGCEILILPFDKSGKDLVGRLATRLSASALTEVVDVKEDKGEMKWVRPLYGDKAYGEYTTTRSKVVVGLRPKSQEQAVPAETRTGSVIPLEFKPAEKLVVTKLVERIESAISGVRLEEAKIIVAGGRGIGDSEGFLQLESLANVLGGTVGASRAACDAGWVPANLQVGQTGAIVAPDLYIAVGISGASQHLSGIANAKTVVAINSDEEAAIFKRANIGVVADYKTILPALTVELQKKMGSYSV